MAFDEAQGVHSASFRRWEDQQIAADIRDQEIADELSDTSELEQAAVLLSRNGMDMEEVAQVICEGIFYSAEQDVYDAAHENLMDAMRAAQSEVA